MTESSVPRESSASPTDMATLERLASATMYDRAVGTLIGSAIGDAVGLYTEFLRKDRIAYEYPTKSFTLLPDPTPFARDFHRLKHTPGEWTDDTDHALLILLSFLHGTLSPKDVAKRLKIWVKMGLRALDSPPLGLGATVGAIVHSPTYLEDPVKTAYDHWVKGGHAAAPNGSLMRTHPLGVICVHRSLEETFETAARFSCITHVDPRCVVACMIGTALVRGLIRSEVTAEAHVDEMIQAAIKDYNERIVPLFRSEGPFTDQDPPLNVDEVIQHCTAENLDKLELDQGGIGYVLKCLGSGIILLRAAMLVINAPPVAPHNHPSGVCNCPPQPMTPRSFLEAKTTVFGPLMTELVLQGGDADTNACFAGALLGAYLGYLSLPLGWRNGLRHNDWIMGKAEATAVVLGLREGQYDGDADTDTALDGGRGFLTEDQMERRWMELQARMATEHKDFLKQEEEKAKKRTKNEALWRFLNWN